MALSRITAQFAAEIKQHDWSDAPYRADKAGHNRQMDGRHASSVQLDQKQTEMVTMNAAWVVAQVLAYNDPNFNEHEFFEACGLNARTKDGRLSGGVTYGLRFESIGSGKRRFQIPGTYRFDTEPEASPTGEVTPAVRLLSVTLNQESQGIVGTGKKGFMPTLADFQAVAQRYRNDPCPRPLTANKARYFVEVDGIKFDAYDFGHRLAERAFGKPDLKIEAPIAVMKAADRLELPVWTYQGGHYTRGLPLSPDKG
ncbi:hypothetical protein [Streptomyces sp. NPDC102282]|uniref:hypothetical protein n=1 Tax=Streptomyces sp. NPDC102282 TaxID=3366154 RepID=UPI00382AAC2F